MAENRLAQEVRIVRFTNVGERSGFVARQRQVDALTGQGWRMFAASTVGEHGEHSDAYFEREIPVGGVPFREEGEFKAPPPRGDVRGA